MELNKYLCSVRLKKTNYSLLKIMIMNWENVDLTDGYERERDFLDGYSFDTLLLEIQCNLKEINRGTVEKQFLEALSYRINDAKEIFYNNIDNIVAQAKKERKY